MYIPKNRIITNQYTTGNEFVFLSDNTSYIGFYYKLYTGEFFTGKTPNDPPNDQIIKSSNTTDGIWERTSKDQEFQQFADNYDGFTFNDQQQNMESVGVYHKLRKEGYSETKLLPQQFYPIPNIEEYALGTFTRYFCVKANQPIYLELNKETFNFLTNQDPNYLWEPYRPFKLQWTLKGEKKSVYNTNRDIVLLFEKRNKLLGFQKFLRENYIKFYK